MKILHETANLTIKTHSYSPIKLHDQITYVENYVTLCFFSTSGDNFTGINFKKSLSQ